MLLKMIFKTFFNNVLYILLQDGNQQKKSVKFRIYIGITKKTCQEPKGSELPQLKQMKKRYDIVNYS